MDETGGTGKTEALYIYWWNGKLQKQRRYCKPDLKAVWDFKRRESREQNVTENDFSSSGKRTNTGTGTPNIVYWYEASI
jgi:hypothetical protein